jgi:hypothetical protein
MDINAKGNKGGLRGPFEILEHKSGSVPTYPILWSHNADRERTLSFEAESEALPRKAKSADVQKLIDSKVAALWATASHCHFSRDTRFTSQSTAMQFSQQVSLGGRAWLSIQLPSPDLEKALVLWGNSTLGLLIHWLYSNRQHAGRGSIGREPLPDLPALDVRALSREQLKEAVAAFDELSSLPLLPIYQLDKDPVRALLDERLGRGVLGLEANHLAGIDLLRRKLAAEPSLRGGKDD